MTKSVVIWSKVPPPMGGVGRSAVLLAGFLRDEGVSTTVVDIGRPLAALVPAVRAWSRSNNWNLFNVSTFPSIQHAGWVNRIARGTGCIFLHGSSFVVREPFLSARERRSYARVLESFDSVWVTNDMLADCVRSVTPRPSVKIVSPFPSSGRIAPAAHNRHRPRVVVASYGGSPIYGLDIAVGAVGLCREAGIPLELDVVMYGPESADRRSAESSLSAIPWVTLWNEPTPEELGSLMAGSDALLRPTERDGDSLLVREALAQGTRVIASDAVARPRGTEVAKRTSASFHKAYTDGGVVSTGAGLGEPIDVVLSSILKRS